MRRLIVIVAMVLIATMLSSTPNANASQTRAPDVELLTITCGAVSYDMSGDDILSSSTFTSANSTYFDTTGLSGNLGVFGVFTHSDASAMISWAAGNPSQLVDIDIVANNLMLDLNGDCVADVVDRFVLDSEDFGITDFAVSFLQLAADGYTKLADGIWIDACIVSDSTVALSLVVDNFYNQNWANYGLTDIDADLLCGTLGEGTPGVSRDSGVWLNAVPEPATILLFSLGTFIIRRK